MALAVAACTHHGSNPFAEVRHLPVDGWAHDVPLVFEPDLPDTATARYAVDLIVRHDDTFPFSSLSLAVDFLPDSAAADRHNVVCPLADNRGYWTGAGFGALYQQRIAVASGVRAEQLHRVVVWNTTDTAATLRGVADIALQIIPDRR